MPQDLLHLKLDVFEPFYGLIQFSFCMEEEVQKLTDQFISKYMKNSTGG